MEARVEDMVEDMMSSGILLNQSSATCISYVRFAKLLLKNVQLLPLSERLSEEAGTLKDLKLFHLGSHDCM